ncbi:60Kd inner membrane protein-domain-containing protein [Dendryphion nanum]|uniref:60Kd inner membrane protein-domain-containing protein n=1 Tax=Dendryphion nanum TaxID=256645 RepID=A0A9P9EAW1_9PLEO|nr:60Kd inner membrane protein-domain-containing protein [Dendryphion nanum]
MIPSRGLRGLRPAHIAQCTSNSTSLARISTSRQFSSLRRTSALPTTSNRTSTLHSASWRTGAIPHTNQGTTANSLRYASWWGKTTSPAEFQKSHQDTLNEQVQQATVTTATPELAPAGIDKAAVVDGSSAANATSGSQGSVESLIDGLLVDPSASALATSSATSAIDPTELITKVGTLKELGLDYGWGVTAFFEWLVEHAYVYTGYGWGSSIVLSALAIRFVGFFLFQTRASDNMAKVAAVQPLTKDMFTEMQEAMKSGDQARQTILRKKQQQIYKAIGASPMAGMWPLGLQAAFGFGAFRCLRGMTELPVPGLENGGFFWFENLAISDPLYILPLATGAVMHLLMKRGGETGAQDHTSQAGPQIALTYIMPVFFTAITAFQPAALQMYFVVTTLTGAVTAQILRTPSFRNALKLSPLPTKESKEFWAKVASGQIPIERVNQEMAKPTYLAPNPTSSLPNRPDVVHHRGINVKKAAIPDHLKPAETKIDKRLQVSDVDFDQGPPDNLMGKMNWFARNYRPKFLWNRSKRLLASYTSQEVADKVLQRRKDIAKRKAEEFEARRRERMRK